MQNNVNVYATELEEDIKLYDYLKYNLRLSYRQTNQFLKNKQISINNTVITKNKMIHKGEVLALHFVDEHNEYEPIKMPLKILYETDDLLIIDKPPHIVVHPTKHILTGTIANGISYYFNAINLKRKIRFVNRLDRDTSGILIIAKNPYSHGFLSKQFEKEEVTKKYYAIVKGRLDAKNSLVETKIKKVDKDIKYEVNVEGKQSTTLFKVIKEYEDYSIIECELKTGRTHQIRVSLETLGTAIIGDSLYDEKSTLINRQALHAYQFNFIEPRTFKYVELICELPDDMKKLL